MKILYIVHASPWVEFSGTPLIAGQYAKAAVARGHSVAIMTPGLIKLPPSSTGEWVGIRLLSWEALPNWSQSAFTEEPKKFSQPPNSSWPFPEFIPNIVHIVDWVGISPSVLYYLRALNVPILRHVWNFEDFCQFIEPIHKNRSGLPCPAPLSPALCADCICQSTRISLKSGEITLSDLKNQITHIENVWYANAYKISESREIVVKNHFDHFYDHLLFASRSFFDYWRRFIQFEKPFSIIPHGCEVRDLSDTERYPTQEVHFVYTAGGSYRKGWDVVERVFMSLFQSGTPGIRLRVYGGINLSKNSHLALYPQVEFFDSYSPEQTSQIFAWADIGIIPSRFETYCRVVREMMLCGVVPIASKAFGIPDVVEDGVNGILIDVEPSSLQKAISRVLEDRLLLDKLKSAVRDTFIIEPEAEFKAIEELYRSLVNSC